MTTRAAEKIIEALTMLMEGYAELQESVETEYGVDPEDDEIDEDSALSSEVDAAIITEAKSAIEAVIEAEDFAPEEIASLVSTLTDALEEIDPDIFEVPGTEEIDVEADDEDIEIDDEEYEDDEEFDDFDDDEEEEEEDDDDY